MTGNCTENYSDVGSAVTEYGKHSKKNNLIKQILLTGLNNKSMAYYEMSTESNPFL